MTASSTARPTVAVSALGVRVDVDLPDHAVAESFARAWEACLQPDNGDCVDMRAHVTGEDLAEHSPDSALELLTQRVTIEAIGARAGQLLMFHACALADDAGRAVVMVGPSGTGKTTMARTHGRRWRYVTDETAAIDVDGALLAYPKPLSVSREGSVKAQVSPGDAGLRVAREPLRVAKVLLLERREEPVDVEVRPVGTVPAIARLAEHTSYLARMERPLARIARLLHDTGDLLTVQYAEAADLTPLLADLLGEGESAR